MYQFENLPDYLEILRSKMRIAVIYGGNKDQAGAVIYPTHNPRPWKSYEAVGQQIKTTLQDLGFEQVFILAEDMNLAQNLAKQGIHLAWLNTGGVQGYNPLGHAPSTLEMLGIPYLGHNPLDASILDQKSAFKRELQGLGLNTAPFITWHPYPQGRFNPHLHPQFKSVFGDYGGPFVVKPVTGRATLHISVIDRVADLPHALESVYEITQNSVLIEKYLPGREFCITVSGYVNCLQGQFFKQENPFAFCPLERVFEPGERIFTSMDKKAITNDRAHLLSPQENTLKQQLIALGQQIYWDFSLRSIVRLDIRADSDGTLHVLEANPKPDLTKPSSEITSLVSIGLAEAGMSYHDLILGLIADRLHHLFTYQPHNSLPLTQLLV